MARRDQVVLRSILISVVFCCLVTLVTAGMLAPILSKGVGAVCKAQCDAPMLKVTMVALVVTDLAILVAQALMLTSLLSRKDTQ
jgi:hypothetical protein